MSSAGSKSPNALKAVELRRDERTREARPAYIQRGSHQATVEMVNVSGGGACFLSPRPFALGHAVRLQVGHGANQLIIDGRVVRYREREDGLHEIGIRISDAVDRFQLLQRFPKRR